MHTSNFIMATKQYIRYMRSDLKFLIFGIFVGALLITPIALYQNLTILREDFNSLSTEYSYAVSENNELKKDISIRAAEYEQLSQDFDLEQRNNADLNIQIKNMGNDLLIEREQKTSLQKELDLLKIELETGEEHRKTLSGIIDDFKSIPSTPAISDLNFKLYGGPSGSATQMAISYPDIRISGVVGTGSMNPGISSQSMTIQTSSFNPNTLTPGQIIVYEDAHGDSIIHRIHKVKQLPSGICYETKGDANFYSDPECIEPNKVKYLVLGVLFRSMGARYSYCSSELTFGPESTYCPVN